VPAASISLMPGTICLTKTDRLTNDPVGIAPVGSFIYEPADVDVGIAARLHQIHNPQPKLRLRALKGRRGQTGAAIEQSTAAPCGAVGRLLLVAHPGNRDAHSCLTFAKLAVALRERNRMARRLRVGVSL
jgi:hypothetical protein